MPPPLFPLGRGFSVGGRLDRSDREALARAGVRTIINNRPDGEDPGQLPAAEARRIAELHGLTFPPTPLPPPHLSPTDSLPFPRACPAPPPPPPPNSPLEPHPPLL